MEESRHLSKEKIRTHTPRWSLEALRLLPVGGKLKFRYWMGKMTWTRSRLNVQPYSGP